jgi:hypothetical protein
MHTGMDKVYLPVSNLESACSAPNMIDFLIIAVMLGIFASLGSGLYFLVRDRGNTERTVISLTIRVALAIALLILLAVGFISRYS